jgi:transcriptional regulator with XRE-family HTH domain
MKKRSLPFKKVMAKRLKILRKRLGLMKKDLATQLGISPSTISTLENQKQLPTIPIIVALINTYHISPFWLLTGEGERFIKDKEPGLSRLEHFKRAFPRVPAEPDVIGLIESMAIPVLKNSLILKSLELKELYRPQIEEYEKEKNRTP